MENNVLKSKSVSKRISSYFAKYKLNIILILLFSIAEALITVMSPKIAGRGITALSATDSFGNPCIDMNYIFKLLTFLLVLYSVSGFCSCMGKYLLSKTSVKIVYDIRAQMSLKISKISVKYIEEKNAGDILSSVVNDAEAVSMLFIDNIRKLISSVIVSVGTVCMMISISWEMTLVSLGMFPVMLAVMAIVFKNSQKYFNSYRQKLGEINSCVDESFSGYETVKTFSAENYFKNKFGDLNISLKEKSFKSGFLSGMVAPIMNFLSNISYVLCCVIGGYFSIVKGLGIGDITAFIAYSAEINRPLTEISSIGSNFQSAYSAGERILKFLDAPEELCDDKNESIILHDDISIEFKNVSFGYDKNKQVLKNISFKVGKGQNIAIVGETGSGKSTILKLLLRFYDISSGEILLGGQNINNLSIKQYREYFSVVTQESWLYHTSIMENIRYGNLKASDEEIKKTADLLGIGEFITSLPKGYETIIEENANNLSEGQKQMICITRAVLSHRPILILDEATASVDTLTENKLQSSLSKILSQKTSIVVAHRLSTIKNADIIIVLKDGHVQECGKHHELISNRSTYFEMYSKAYD